MGRLTTTENLKRDIVILEGRSGRVISTSAAREARDDGSRTLWSVGIGYILHRYQNMDVASTTCNHHGYHYDDLNTRSQSRIDPFKAGLE